MTQQKPLQTNFSWKWNHNPLDSDARWMTQKTRRCYNLHVLQQHSTKCVSHIKQTAADPLIVWNCTIKCNWSRLLQEWPYVSVMSQSIRATFLGFSCCATLGGGGYETFQRVGERVYWVCVCVCVCVSVLHDWDTREVWIHHDYLQNSVTLTHNNHTPDTVSTWVQRATTNLFKIPTGHVLLSWLEILLLVFNSTQILSTNSVCYRDTVSREGGSMD